MKKYLLILSLGFFSLTTQSILVREFLNTLECNELTIGVFFFSWFFWIFPGSALGRLLKNKSNLFPILTLLYIPSWFVGHFLISNAHSIYGVPTYETFPIKGILLIGILGPSGVSITTGFLFPLASLWWEKKSERSFSSSSKDLSSSEVVRHVYALEALGAVVGGVITTLTIYYGLSIWIPFMLSAWLIGFSVILQKNNIILNVISVALLPLTLTGAIYIDRLENLINWKRAIKGGEWDTKIFTQQAEYIFGKKNNQTIILKNKKVFLNLPNDEYGLNLTATILAQKQDVKTIALIGERLVYLIPFLQKIKAIEKVLWLPTDYEIGKDILKAMERYYSWNPKKIFIPSDEPRKFISSTSDKYDAIIVHTGDPTTISLSRYTTQHFLKILKSRITEDGIIGICLTGGENFLGTELSHYGASIFNTISSVFQVTAIKPGEESFIFASNKYPISEHVPALENRLRTLTSDIPEINPTIVRNLYAPDRIKFQKEVYEKILKNHSKNDLLITEDNISSFLFSILFYLSKMGIRGLIYSLPAARRIVKIIFVGIPISFFIFRSLYKLKRSKNLILTISFIPESIFAISSLGASAIGVNLILLTLFQFTYGSITTFIGFLSAAFMLGISFAPFIYDQFIHNKKTFYEAITIAISSSITFITLAIPLFRKEAPFLYYFLGLLFWGFLSGLLVSAILERLKTYKDTSYVSAHLEMWDHIGACIGSVAIPLLLLPLTGVIFTLLVIILNFITAITAFFVLKPIKAPVSSLWGRKIGYILTPVVVLLISSSLTTKSQMPQLPENYFTSIAKQMVKEQLLIPSIRKIENNEILFFEIKHPRSEETLGYIFSTGSLFKVIGYAGEIDLAVRVNKEGLIEDVQVITSEETPEYFSRVEENLFLYKGKSILSSDTIDSVDIVSGATTSSEAVKRAVKYAGEKFARIIAKEQTIPSSKFRKEYFSKSTISLYTLFAFTLLALLLRYQKKRVLRIIWLLLIIFILGIYFNLQLSTFHILQLLIPKTYLNVNFSSTFLLLAIAVFVIPLFGNIYCGYLCPFGAMSELFAEINFLNKRINPSHKAWYFSRQIKYWILFLLTTTYLLTSDSKIVSVDPLTTFFNFEITSLPFIIGAIAIILSLLYKRFWCRVICPTGALLSIFQSLRILNKIWQRTLPSKCDLGIRYREEIDCIQCNRCFFNEKK